MYRIARDEMYDRLYREENWKLYVNESYWVLAIEGFFEFYFNPLIYLGKIRKEKMPPAVVQRLEQRSAVFTDYDRAYQGDHFEQYDARNVHIGHMEREGKFRSGNLFYSMGAWCATVNGQFLFEDPYGSEGNRKCDLQKMTWFSVDCMMRMSAISLSAGRLWGIEDLDCFNGYFAPGLVESEAWSAGRWAKMFDEYSHWLRFGWTCEDFDFRKGLRTLRRDIFLHTVDCVCSGGYVAENGEKVRLPRALRMIAGTEFYSREIPPGNRKPSAITTQVRVENEDCLMAAKKLLDAGLNPAVLNMANRQNPGGGVLEGAGAQEENLFRRSNLFQSLFRFAPYAREYGLIPARSRYPLDRNFGGVYTPGATVFRGLEKDGYPMLEEPFQVSVISVAGMNRPELDSSGKIADHLIPGMKNKIRTIFRIGIRNGHDSLVLGALGCGAFRNPPEHVAQLFHEVMEEAEFRNRFRVICFAILEDHNSGHSHNRQGNYLPFAREFGTES